MAATTTGSSDFPLATEDPYAGDAGSETAPGVGTGNEGGAAGGSYGGPEISTGALIAIVVVVVAVSIIGVAMAALFFIAKKREWTMKETLRRSARKVVTALTPRRTEFPSSVKESMGGSSRKRGARLPDDVPPTPRLRPEDLEKGMTLTEIKAQKKKGRFAER